MVGISASIEAFDTVAASSTQARLYPSNDLMEASLPLSPKNENTEPLQPRISFSVKVKKRLPDGPKLIRLMMSSSSFLDESRMEF